MVGGGTLVQQMGGVVYIGYWLVLKMTIWMLRLMRAHGEELVGRQVFWLGQPIEG